MPVIELSKAFLITKISSISPVSILFKHRQILYLVSSQLKSGVLRLLLTKSVMLK